VNIIFRVNVILNTVLFYVTMLMKNNFRVNDIEKMLMKIIYGLVENNCGLVINIMSKYLNGDFNI
jgi:hypothetical protein